jgi:hypothetical protein
MAKIQRFMAKKNKIPEFLPLAKKILQERPRFVAIESKNFFKDCFQKGGWTDDAFLPWQSRISPLGGKKILIGKNNTMNLMQSIRTLERNKNRVRTGSDLEYADTHNGGAEITVTAKMKRFWWARYCEIAGVKKGENGKSNWKDPGNLRTETGRVARSKKARAASAKAEYCKHMALMKAGSKIRIPKRQFIGESKTLLKEFEVWFAAEIEKLK